MGILDFYLYYNFIIGRYIVILFFSGGLTQNRISYFLVLTLQQLPLQSHIELFDYTYKL